MSAFFASLGLPELVAGIMVLSLNAYVLMGGADFGGGVWDLLASGPRRDRQRALITDSIAPIWEANHVWLIVVVVVLFTAFPIVYATLTTVLHIPLVLFLVGIVLRGSAFVFRSYGGHEPRGQRRWGLAFAGASTLSPMLLGVIIGAVSSGAAGVASTRIGSASFPDVFVAPWLAAYPIALGAFALALFAFLAAVYLALEAKDAALEDDFRTRALAAGILVFLLAAVVLMLAYSEAPRVAAGVMGSSWSIALQFFTGAAAVTALVALWKRKFEVARVAAAAQVSCILWGWAFAQYPLIVPDVLTIHDAAAPRVTLELLLTGLGVGALILIPSLRYLFRIFAGRAADLSAGEHASADADRRSGKP